MRFSGVFKLRPCSPWLFLLVSPAFVLFFNEYLIYYLVIRRCDWPAQGRTNVMLIADTHLLGIRNGHWFDKLRREWQMYRSFQTSISLLQPKAVFFLGDLFDEGQWSSDQEFHTYLERFDSLFRADGVPRSVVVGNHDIGFHYAIVPHRLQRFSNAFQTSQGVDTTVVEGNVFVMVNSMAMERDGCRLCGEAERDIQSLAGCLYSGERCSKPLPSPVPRPILLQHFPLYRKSDMECEESPDLAPEDVISEKFRESWECLSENSTLFLLENLRPRAAFGGHTHFGCKKWWKTQYGFWEYTVPSFSWRNNRHPALLLLSVSPEQVAVARCFMPHEHTVVAIYGAFIFLWGAVLVFALANLYASRNRNKRVNKFVLVPDKLS